MRSKFAGFGAVLVLALVVAACSSSKDSTSAPPQQVSVAITGFKFLPDTVTVPKGSTVTWTNNDTPAHTVTSDNGSELASGNVAKSGTFAHQFMTAGTYTYHCAIHATMPHAVVIVQ